MEVHFPNSQSDILKDCENNLNLTHTILYDYTFLKELGLSEKDDIFFAEIIYLDIDGKAKYRERKMSSINDLKKNVRRLDDIYSRSYLLIPTTKNMYNYWFILVDI